MPRVDLPEIEDQPWCPKWLRDAMTGYLQTAIELTQPYAVAGKALSGLLESSGSQRIIDLASGAGGPWRHLFAELQTEHPSLEVRLSDIEPNQDAIASLGRGQLSYVTTPVSALAVPPEQVGIRTMFTSLHHFDREQVRTILSSAQRDGVGFAAFEATHRSLRGVLLTFIIPVLVLFLMPRVRPRRALPLFLTYLPPILPLLIWWDGFASTVRTYSVSDIQALLAEIQQPGYAWAADEVSVAGSPIPVLQVIGRPEATGA